MIEIISSAHAAASHGVKVLVHARSGYGKTMLCATAPSPLVISAESGLLSLRHLHLPTVVIRTMTDLMNVYRYLSTSSDARQFATVCLDSITDVADVALAKEKGLQKDPRKAYGNMADEMTDLIRAFRDLPMNVYFSARQERIKDETTGALLYGPSMPGRQIGPQLPYFFDEVFALDLYRDEFGTLHRYLRTGADGVYEAKDRSGALDPYEPANLTHVFDKIRSTVAA